MKENFRLILFTCASFIICICTVQGQATKEEQLRNRPVVPFKIIENIYYVGASDITAYLITTPSGHILIDSGFFETVPQIIRNIAKLGFKLEDVKIILNSHAHHDHAGGLAELRRLTKARLMISEADVELMASGGKGDPNFGDRFSFEPTKPDETFKDGRKVKLGGTTIKANITAGHTKGCTTWTTTANENNRKLKVVFVCSTSSPGYKLVGNSDYPEIASDYAKTFARLRTIKADVFLGSHGVFFDLETKANQKRSVQGSNPFIDPQGYREYLNRSEADFLKMLKRQKEQPKK